MNDGQSLRSSSTIAEVSAPALPYRPCLPRSYRPRIGLIGCGGISAHHLAAYRQDGLDVVALCARRPEQAEARRAEFFPAATVYADHHLLLKRADIDVVDIALPPGPRAAVIADALRAGKHVLSQKPFVLDLDEGERLVALAAAQNRLLAVNQNGRWAPYAAYARQAVAAGLLGTIDNVTMTLAWDHTWIRGTAFEQERQLILLDFAIHWLDLVRCFMPGAIARQVTATTARANGQDVRPDLLAHIGITCDRGMATLAFNGHARGGVSDERLAIHGGSGMLTAIGDVCAANDLRLTTMTDGAARRSVPDLEGEWFDDGFRGTMGELLCAIEDDRQPGNSAADNLGSLALAFAAAASADRGGAPVAVGSVRRVG